MKSNSIIVIPDVHGRSFWKDALLYKDNEIVFLGDYLDPYPYEGITQRAAIENFKEIISFAKENTGRVHLLLGNHDLHYIGFSSDSCRMDIENLKEIYNLYNDNKEMFSVAHRWKNTLFTHAGVTRGWLSSNFTNTTCENIDMYLNNELYSKEWELPLVGFSGVRNCNDSPLGQCGRGRGGDYMYGSCTWADIRELSGDIAFDNIYQIVGHTQLKDTGKYLHNDNWYLCDSRSCFIWNESELNKLIK